MPSYSYIKHAKKIFIKDNIFPEYVTFFVTARCNLSCAHCFYWKNINSKATELSIDEIKSISKSMDEFNLLIVTGGEPFLRKDIAEIVSIFHETNNVQNIIIPTNGYFTDKIIKDVKNMLASCPNLHLLVETSIDDIGTKHDKIRNAKNAFQNAITTISRLKELKKHHTNLSVGIISVFSKLNQDHFESIYNFIRDKIVPDSITVALIRGNPKENIKGIDIKKYEEVTKWINRDFLSKKLGFKFKYSNVSKATTMVLRDLIAKTHKSNKQTINCYAGKISAVIYPNGDVFPCELLDKKIGNLRSANYDFSKVWFSEKAKEITKWISKTKCYCTHECNMTSNILFDKKQWSTKLLPQLIRLKLK